MAILILVTLILAALALFGGGEYAIIRNGPRWADEQHAREEARNDYAH